MCIFSALPGPHAPRCQIAHDTYPLKFHSGQFKDMPRSRKNFSRAQKGQLPHTFHQTFDIYSILHWNFEISNVDPTDIKNQFYPISLQNVHFQYMSRSPCPPCQIAPGPGTTSIPPKNCNKAYPTPCLRLHIWAQLT